MPRRVIFEDWNKEISDAKR